MIRFLFFFYAFSRVGVGRCVDIGRHISGEIFRHMQTIEVQKMADPVPRIQNDRRSLDCQPRLEQSHTRRVDTESHERSR